MGPIQIQMTQLFQLHLKNEKSIYTNKLTVPRIESCVVIYVLTRTFLLCSKWSQPD